MGEQEQELQKLVLLLSEKDISEQKLKSQITTEQ